MINIVTCSGLGLLCER